MPLRSLILTALFAALTAVGAFLRVPVGDTSFTLQVLFTCMAGVLLGPRYGTLSQLLYLALPEEELATINAVTDVPDVPEN